MAIYSEFSHEKWWFSIVILVYQRVNPIVRPRPKQHRCRSWDTRNRCRSRPQAWPPSWWAPRARCGSRCGTAPKQIGDLWHVKLYIQYYDVIYIYIYRWYVFIYIYTNIGNNSIYIEQYGYTLPIYIHRTIRKILKAWTKLTWKVTIVLGRWIDLYTV